MPVCRVVPLGTKVAPAACLKVGDPPARLPSGQVADWGGSLTPSQGVCGAA